MMQAIFEDQTENATSAVFRVVSLAERKSYPGLGGETLTFIASGTFGDATITIEAGPTAAGPWVALPDGAFTATTVQVAPISRRVFLRAVVSGAGASTDVSLWIG